MTDREALREYIDNLSDEDALALWQRIQCEEAYSPPPLTPAQRQSVERSLADLEHGRTIPHEDVIRRFRPTA